MLGYNKYENNFLNILKIKINIFSFSKVNKNLLKSGKNIYLLF